MRRSSGETSFLILYSYYPIDIPPTINRLSDDNALRAKVQEALSVYDEYLKTKGDPDESTKQGANADGEAEKNE